MSDRNHAWIKTSHLLLDILLAQDVARQVADSQGAVGRDNRSLAAQGVFDAALVKLDVVGLFNFEWAEDGGLKYEMGPLLAAVTGPMLFLATELAACADITLDDVVSHCRDYIESQRSPVTGPE